jgi:hypothetical protein
MQLSGVSLTLTWPHTLCLLRVFLGVMPMLQAFPFPSTLGEVTLHQLSPACVFIYSYMGSGSSPLSCGVFLPPTLLQAFPLLVAGRVLPLLPFPAWLVYLQFCEGFPSPAFQVQGTLPPLLCDFFVVIAYYSVFLFSLGGGWSLQGAMLIWPRVVCGSTMCRSAHLVVCIFLSHLGPGVWQQHGSPPVLHLT